MSRVLVIGDTHFGHKNVTKFRREFSSVEEHDGYIIGQWCASVKKEDLVFVCGDAAFTEVGLENFRKLPGRKILVRGNHDVFSANRYLIFFEDIAGLVPYKTKGVAHKYRGGSCWISHAPIHPEELRGRKNIHGHVHSNTIKDNNYRNVSAENIGYIPMDIREVLEKNYDELMTD